MASPLKAGDRVICVDDKSRTPDIEYLFPEELVLGRIYTVRKTVFHEFDPMTWGVILEEIRGKPHPKHGRECGFFSIHFRKWPEDAPQPRLKASSRHRKPSKVS